MEANGLVMMQATNELRWNHGALEQKWIASPMQYTHKWVKVRSKIKGEL